MNSPTRSASFRRKIVLLFVHGTPNSMPKNGIGNSKTMWKLGASLGWRGKRSVTWTKVVAPIDETPCDASVLDLLPVTA